MVAPCAQPRHAGDVGAVRLGDIAAVPPRVHVQLLADAGAHCRVVVWAAVQLVTEGPELGKAVMGQSNDNYTFGWKRREAQLCRLSI